MTFLYIIGILAAIFLILVVLVQNPKGGGLASNFSSSNSVLGVQRTTEVVEKITWILAGLILVISLWITITSPTATAVQTTQPGIENNTFEGVNIPAQQAPQQGVPGAQQQQGVQPADQGTPSSDAQQGQQEPVVPGNGG